jgi:hypothetical protein
MLKRQRWNRQRCLAALSLAVLFWLGASAAPAAVLVNELLANPGSDWNGDGTVDIKLDEWVEVVNTGLDPVDLAGYFLRDGTGDTPHLGLSGVLAPGAVALFHGSDAVTWQEANDAGTSGLSLNNGGDTVQLVVPDPNDPLVYLVVDTRTYLPHEGEAERASGLLEGAWTMFDGLNPYGGSLVPVGTGCAPTPGLPNICEITPVVGATWGGLKAGFE